MVVNCIGADEQLRGNLAVGFSFRGAFGDLAFLVGELAGEADCSTPGTLASGSELESSALGETLCPHCGELFIRQAKLRSGMDPSFLTPEPFSVEKPCVGAIYCHCGGCEVLHSRLKERLRIGVL